MVLFLVLLVKDVVSLMAFFKYNKALFKYVDDEFVKKDP